MLTLQPSCSMTLEKSSNTLLPSLQKAVLNAFKILRYWSQKGTLDIIQFPFFYRVAKWSPKGLRDHLNQDFFSWFLCFQLTRKDSSAIKEVRRKGKIYMINVMIYWLPLDTTVTLHLQSHYTHFIFFQIQKKKKGNWRSESLYNLLMFIWQVGDRLETHILLPLLGLLRSLKRLSAASSEPGPNINASQLRN